MIRAVVVFPEPGGPAKRRCGSSPFLSRRGVSLSFMLAWFTKSSSFFGLYFSTHIISSSGIVQHSCCLLSLTFMKSGEAVSYLFLRAGWPCDMPQASMAAKVLRDLYKQAYEHPGDRCLGFDCVVLGSCLPPPGLTRTCLGLTRKLCPSPSSDSSLLAELFSRARLIPWRLLI